MTGVTLFHCSLSRRNYWITVSKNTLIHVLKITLSSCCEDMKPEIFEHADIWLTYDELLTHMSNILNIKFAVMLRVYLLLPMILPMIAESRFCHWYTFVQEYEILIYMQNLRNLFCSCYDSLSNHYFSRASSDNRHKKICNDNTWLYGCRKLTITEERNMSSTLIVKSVNVGFNCLSSKKRKTKNI